MIHASCCQTQNNPLDILKRGRYSPLTCAMEKNRGIYYVNAFVNKLMLVMSIETLLNAWFDNLPSADVLKQQEFWSNLPKSMTKTNPWDARKKTTFCSCKILKPGIRSEIIFDLWKATYWSEEVIYTYCNPIESMVMVYLPTWMAQIYGFHVGKYTSPMDPTWEYLQFYSRNPECGKKSGTWGGDSMNSCSLHYV